MAAESDEPSPIKMMRVQCKDDEVKEINRPSSILSSIESLKSDKVEGIQGVKHEEEGEMSPGLKMKQASPTKDRSPCPNMMQSPGMSEFLILDQKLPIA